MRRRAVLLDRDGVLNEERSFVRRPEDLVLRCGVREALARLSRAGWLLLVVTNQSALARGLMDWNALHEIHRRLRELTGGVLDAIYVCPHHPVEGRGPLVRDCPCRKPKPGLIEQARAEWGFAIEESFLLGDRPRDLAAARAAGLQPVAVGRWPAASHRPDPAFPGLPEAAAWLLGR